MAHISKNIVNIESSHQLYKHTSDKRQHWRVERAMHPVSEICGGPGIRRITAGWPNGRL